MNKFFKITIVAGLGTFASHTAASAQDAYATCRADIAEVRSLIVKTNWAAEDRDAQMAKAYDCALACSGGRFDDAAEMIEDIREAVKS